ncbi:VOC family protein [Deinococcus yavapaiensis]|uniref:Catechol 2,3-dioxygenase-like lactoylglutathione lyase family enzyme n=1 Tax=Deinococcus yavapaiensis KR-236 TaxID=694435 RepID=A0A318S1R9_9DEIO|nr:VOC family protein [Deinococcus yavapaiensis]PYE51166.1 catechol 2,3-dioxygenase-like lactoylglutathione lyase family enzyme [Deinococcus yavapaiensis KR-236]
MLRFLHHVTLYVPDLRAAVTYYEALGLKVESTSNRRVLMRFEAGEAKLELHDDERAQFTDVNVGVTDLASTYKALSRNPGVAWLETPREGRATLRGPDGNVLVLCEERSATV